MDIDSYDKYLAEIRSAKADLDKQLEYILSQAEHERRKIDLYLADKTNEVDRECKELRQKIDIYLNDRINELAKEGEELRKKELELRHKYKLHKKLLDEEYEKKNKELSCKEESLRKLKLFLDDIEHKNITNLPYYFSCIRDFKASLFDEAEQFLNEERSAWKSAEIVRELKNKYKEEIRLRQEAENKTAFYEYIYPSLQEDIKVEGIKFNIEENEYTEEERVDELHYWLTPEEYRKLPPVEKNQKALDRYKKNLSKWEIGKLYENYVGYLHEQVGYKVNYTGIKDKFEDRGRDLICEKDNEVLIIQCKNWSASKTIYEKHIFQFFGSVFEYTKNVEEKRDIFPRKVRGIFYTTTELSDFAREAANFLKIELVENHAMNKDYSCIKCNKGKDGEKIYHLPFDQQYDSTKIEPKKGEFYAKTCQEAESAGYRRAMRYFH